MPEFYQIFQGRITVLLKLLPKKKKKLEGNSFYKDIITLILKPESDQKNKK